MTSDSSDPHAGRRFPSLVRTVSPTVMRILTTQTAKCDGPHSLGSLPGQIAAAVAGHFTSWLITDGSRCGRRLAEWIAHLSNEPSWRVIQVTVVAVYLLGSTTLAADSPSTVTIITHGDGYQLLRNGVPYFVKGACGGSRWDELVVAGGNSVRLYSLGPAFDQAQQKGLSVLAGLGMGSPRHGFNYAEPEQVAKQREKIRQQVLKYKGHPALLMWAVGNEVELSASKEDRIRVWKAINEIASMIKEIDGHHPCIAIVAGIGGNKLRELDEYCPALDAVGINTYSAIMSVPSDVRNQGWKRPWFVTEFGPRGHWEVAKTPWGMPIEDTSTLKSELYLKGYRKAIEGQPACLGSYVFLWGQKQEKTHTWYGMFLPEGNRLGPVDAMTMAWTGQWPTNRCPQVGSGRIKARLEGTETDAVRNVFEPGSRVFFAVDASDPEIERLTFRWSLRVDVSDNANVGGDREATTDPIKGAVVSTEENQATIRLPEKEGNYRVFVDVIDTQGSAATANVPIQVKAKPPR